MNPYYLLVNVVLNSERAVDGHDTRRYLPWHAIECIRPLGKDDPKRKDGAQSALHLTSGRVEFVTQSPARLLDGDCLNRIG